MLMFSPACPVLQFSWPVGNGVIQGLRVYKHADIGYA